MKSILCIGVSLLLVFGFFGCAGAPEKKAEPMAALTAMVTATNLVTLDKESKVTISGSGFEANQEVAVIYTDPNGVMADIGYALDPAPKADASGAWTTTWTLGRYASKLIKPGAIALKVVDADYNMLAHTSVGILPKDAAIPGMARVVKASPMAKIDAESKVAISGAGFKPNEEIFILYTDPNGLTADIGYALDPAPKADAAGNWATGWTLGRYAKNLIVPGVTTIEVMDSSYHLVGHASIAFMQ